MRSFTASLACGLAAISAGTLANSASADLEEENVLLIYNELDDESRTIKEAYVAAHPCVHVLDLDLTYADPGNWDSPGTNAITRFYITPASFQSEIYDEVMDFVGECEDTILAIATTRGIPVCVTTDFTPAADHDDNPTKGSVEGLLARGSRTVSWTGLVDNPYYTQVGVGFKEFAIGGAADCMELPGTMFLVSRLDSDIPAEDFDEDKDVDNLDGVLALIERSQDLLVAPSHATLVYDNAATGTYFLPNTPLQAAYMWDQGWSVYYDSTSAFLHGADSAQLLDEENDYIALPELVHVSLGRNHNPNNTSGDEATRFYVGDYNPHPAGLFISKESYNGITLHNPGHLAGGSDDWRHGQALQWIGKGGSFTTCNVNGIYYYEVPHPHYAEVNLYLHHMTWVESIYASMQYLPRFLTPIGDPLARVRTYNADLNGDHKVDGADLGILYAAWGPGHGSADLNRDDQVDGADSGMLLAEWGWEALDRPDVGASSPPSTGDHVPCN